MFLVKLFYGIIFVGIGLALLKYKKFVYGWTGRWYLAEKYLGSGGTIIAICLIGCLLIFIGFAYPLGTFDDLKLGAPTKLDTPHRQTNSNTTP